MAIIVSIVLGLVAGFIASKIMNRSADGVVLNAILGLLGALGGGVLFSKFSMAGLAAGPSLLSMAAALTGAIVVLFVFHTFLRRTIWRRPRGGWH